MTTPRTFDPNAAALEDSGVFGLPYTHDEAALVYLPVPWEATTSYGGGTSDGPAAILEGSKQVDLFHIDVHQPYAAGLFMQEESQVVRDWNERAKALAQKIIEVGGNIDGNSELKRHLDEVNQLSSQINTWVYEQSKTILAQKKLLALVGGDHSTPLGAFKAISEKHPGFGILHFDAHSDTRIAYEGFHYSHASIMYNALEELPALKKLVQVGIRDVCEQEIDYCKQQGNRVSTFFDRDLKNRKFSGETWAKTTQDIIAQLPQEVWISFDIDGLDPRFCPHTGTPVPGGLEFSEATYLMNEVARSGRKIIGFDLNEVAPSSDVSDEWDANVGARLLYHMSAVTLVSQGLRVWR